MEANKLHGSIPIWRRLKKITFILERDELRYEARAAIAALSSPEHFKDVHDVIAEAESIHKQTTSSAASAISDEELVEIQKACDKFELLISRIEEVRRHYPWRISPFSATRIDGMKASMCRHLNDAEVSWRNGINGM